jgi:hypothetical protein
MSWFLGCRIGFLRWLSTWLDLYYLHVELWRKEWLVCGVLWGVRNLKLFGVFITMPSRYEIRDCIAGGAHS